MSDINSDKIDAFDLVITALKEHEKKLDELSSRLESIFKSTMVQEKRLPEIPSDKKEPVIMAMIRLDGTQGGVVHYLGEIKPEDVTIGMAVQAVLKPKKERKGSITDIKYFKPVG